MVMDTWLVTTKRIGSGIGMDGRVVNDFLFGDKAFRLASSLPTDGVQKSGF